MTKPAKIFTVLAVIAAIASGFLYGKGLLNVHQGAVKPAALAVLELQNSPKPAPEVSFADAAGGRHALSAFKGRYVLLNLWATWCASCVAELPALATLKRTVPGLQVLAVDVWAKDTTPDITAFLKSHSAAQLGTLTDPDITLERGFGAYGLPLTVLIDPQGKVIARAEGPAEWATPEAVDYFRELTGS